MDGFAAFGFLPVLFLIPVIAIIGLAVFAVVYGYRRNKQRLAALAALCASEGWQFTPQDPFGLPQRWGGHPFDQGYDRTAENVITGDHDGMALVAFDYSYKEDSTGADGKSSTTTYHHAVVALRMPCALPGLQIAPEGIFSRLGNLLGFQDIELESEEFNRRFRVTCPDPKFASDALMPRTMEFLMANDTLPFRLIGTDAVSFASGALEPYVILRGAHILAGVIGGIPSFVWKDYGMEANAS